MPVIEEAKKQFTFKLRSGSHCYIDPQGKTVTIEPKGILQTNVDMALAEGPDRWEKIDDAGQETLEDLKARIRILESMVPKATESVVPDHEGDDLDSKNIKELRTLAASLEPPVDLTDCNGKTEIINAIRSAMDAA